MDYDTWKTTDFEAELFAQLDEITIEDLEAAAESSAADRYEEGRYDY